MIRSLRRKFIAVTMASVTLVLILVLSVVNYANYRTVDGQLDAKLSTLLAEEQFARWLTGDDDTGNDLFGSTPPTRPDNGDGTTRGFRDFRRDILLMRENDASYFVVSFADGELASVSCRHAAGMDEDTAVELAQGLYAEAADYGFTGVWKYGVTYEEDSDTAEETVTYLFLNCEEAMTGVRRTVAASVLLALLGELMVLILVGSLSHVVTRPAVESYEKQKRFITDASHELKTPIAIIEANTEVMELTDGETEWTASNRRQVARLSSLIEKLVFLSRMDEENNQYLTMADFDLSEAIRDVAEGFLSVAEAKGHPLTLSIEDGIMWCGDENTIRQMVSLLLDNAFKYASDNGEIYLTVSSREHGKHRVRIEQGNPAEGLPQGNLDMLFDRFYRADESRNSEKGGYGIGLSVVRAIVSAHKGTIRAENRDGHSITFTIHL